MDDRALTVPSIGWDKRQRYVPDRGPSLRGSCWRGQCQPDDRGRGDTRLPGRSRGSPVRKADGVPAVRHANTTLTNRLRRHLSVFEATDSPVFRIDRDLGRRTGLTATPTATSSENVILNSLHGRCPSQIVHAHPQPSKQPSGSPRSEGRHRHRAQED